ncbi:hypothetical protein PEDI_22600 [Persicobacter diffluens]|uniref:Uncharacterized protein n=1 Tax=Persicobacter diffluens TaxID=981 RepID=A0AAN5AMB4_9BACT|nr:hypothetical protein PEDI_22600 [Persicobacter diffluens]
MGRKADLTFYEKALLNACHRQNYRLIQFA